MPATYTSIGDETETMMRLTCPNCDAQYQVPDDVVPVEGRDVQCSNCGQTWFQHHRDHMPEAEEAAIAPDAIAPDEETIAPPPPPETPVDDTPQAPLQQAPKQRELDAEVADILQQEAQAEQAARQAARREGLESQPDLGLPNADDADDAERRASEARQRMARMRGEPDPAPEAAKVSEADVNAAAMASRRDLLPDIDEINSTLRTENEGSPAAKDQAQVDGPSQVKRKRGFRRGLMWVLILFVLALLLYIYAPKLAEMVPQLKGPLAAYVAWVDGLRLWLDGQVQTVLRWLDSVASQSGGAATDAPADAATTDTGTDS